MKKTLLNLFGLVLTVSATAQTTELSQPSAAWYNIIDGSTSGGDQANSVATATDGSVYWFGTFGTTDAAPEVKFNNEVLYKNPDYSGTSQNNNFTLIKTDANGQKLWTVYSNSGDFANNSGFCSVLPDGGVVVVSKVRHTDNLTDKNINFVDASGNNFPVEWTCERRSYRIFVTKISTEGSIEWNRMIDVDTTPGPNAAGNYAEFWADCFNLGNGTVDSEGNIYIALNYRNPVTIPVASGEPVVLTPKNTANWTGDAQSSVGDFLLLSLTSEGYYRNNLQLEGDCAVSYCQAVICENDVIYAQGYITGEADKTLAVDGFTLAPTTIMSPLLVATDTSLGVKWAKCFTAEQVAGKNALQNVGIAEINGSLYMCGQYNLKFRDPDDSSKYVASTQGTLREGFIVKFNSATGEWLASRDSRDDNWDKPSAAAKTGLTGYLGVYPNPLSKDKIYVYGYVMNQLVGVFLRVYDAETLVADLPDGQYNVVTGGGVPSAQVAAYNADQAAIYLTARGNKAFTLMADPDITTDAPSTWAILTARFDLPKSASTIVDCIEEGENDAPVEYYNMNGVRISEPSLPGLYIRRQGSTTTKIAVR